MHKRGLICLYALLFAIIALMSSCGTTKCIPQIEYRDSIRVEHVLDSVYQYERDSIYIKEKGDTVFVDKWHIRYKDKLVYRTDTVYVDNKVVQTEEVRYVPTIYKYALGFSIVIILLILVILGIKVGKRLHGL